MPLYILQMDENSAGELKPVKPADIDIEEHLESWLENSPTVLLDGAPVLWIGRQTSAASAETVLYPDLLGVDVDGNVVLVELKRGRAPREVIAQLLEYASWAAKLSAQDIERIASQYWLQRDVDTVSFEDTFREHFLAGDPGQGLPEFNRSQILFVVAEQIDRRVAQVARYLREYGTLDIRCIVFDVHKAASGEVLVSVDAVVGEGTETLSVQRRARTAPSTENWTGDKTASEVIYDTVKQLLAQPDKDTFSPREVYYEILKKYPDFNQGTNNAQITADCVNCPSRKHYPGRNPDRYFRVGHGTYRLYDPVQDGLWDQEGKFVGPYSEAGSVES